MQIGMIGLGRMGANMAHRLVQGGHACVAYDPRPEAVRAVGAYGARGVGSLAELAGALERPRALWIMVPAGTSMRCSRSCARSCPPGDVLIDGGNSHYHDDIRRSAELKGAGLHYLDVGTSGGVLGFEQGYCLMVGGDAEAVALIEPVLATLAPGASYRRARRSCARRESCGRSARLPALRTVRRRPPGEDGAQRHRVRRDGRVRGGPEPAGARQRRHAQRARWTRKPHRCPTRATSSMSSMSPPSPSCGATAASSPRGCST